MGAWGIATFEDDSNLDWLCDLEDEDKPLGFLKECLDLKGIDELDYMSCTGVLCAAVMIDAILNGATKDLPQSAIVWLENNKKLKVQKLLPNAIGGLERILGDKSEMNETWAEEPEHYSKWKKHVNGIKKRLCQSLEASRE